MTTAHISVQSPTKKATPIMKQTPTPTASHHVAAGKALSYIDKRSYAVLASTSPADRSHSAGVIYALSGRDLYFSTLRSSRKARNIVANPNVGITIPVRRVPVGGPPSAIMFQAKAEVLDLDDPRLADLAARGELKAIIGHGELEMSDGCFVKISLPDRLLTYGLGMSLLALIRDPLSAGGYADLSEVD